jgi:serine/threonine-protein kinase
MVDPARIDALTDAILDGTAVDWDDARPAVVERDDVFDQLRAVAVIARTHRRLLAESDGAAINATGTWGHLQLIQHVGRGSFGEVYRAWDPQLCREVALKLLPSTEDAENVLSEGRLLARVRHPNVVTIHGAASHNGRTGLWMEFVEGATLAEIVGARGPLAEDAAVAIGADLCRALAAGHAAGVVHGDVKAQNVIREIGGRIVLTDFGSARPIKTTTPGTPITPLYAAPEVLHGAAPTPASDVYSLGVLLYFATTGAFPIHAKTVASLREAHELAGRVPLQQRCPELSTHFAAAVERAMAANPADRFASALDFERALQLHAAPKAPTVTPDAGQRSAPRGRMLMAAAGVLAATVLVATAWFWTTGDSATVSSAVTAPRLSVLVTAVHNDTGDRELDDVLTYALERELANSGSLNVVMRTRIEDALRLMKRPLESRIDEALGREIVLRDGAIHALVSGRAQKLGSKYIISAAVAAPADGDASRTTSVEVAGLDGLTSALRDLAQGIRHALGEPRSATSAAPLERVTTPSLRALRLYSESFVLGERQQWPAALELARSAIAEDPDFATAQIWLAWALLRNGYSSETFLPVAERAVALASSTTDWERLWIEGSYYGMRGDDRRADGAYTALLRLKPDHYWAANNLAVMYQRQGRALEAVPYIVKLAELRPNDGQTAFRAAHQLAQHRRDFDAARPFVERARAIPLTLTPMAYAWTVHFNAAECLARRDVPGMTAEVTRILGTVAEHPAETRDALVSKAVRYFLSTGQLRQAAVAVERLEDRRFFYPFYRAMVAYAASDVETARRYIRVVPFNSYMNGAAWMMARLGLTAEAEAFLRSGPIAATQKDNVLNGSVALAKGDLVNSVPPLERLIAAKFPGGHARFSSDLAQVWLRRDQRSRAIDVLRTSWDFDRAADVEVDGPYGHDWGPNALTLAELYRDAGYTSDANAIVKDLEKLLTMADADYPPVARLNHLLSAEARVPVR